MFYSFYSTLVSALTGESVAGARAPESNPLARNHGLASLSPALDGVGTHGVFTEGPQIPHILSCVSLSAHALPPFARFCHTCLPHFPMILH